MAVESQPKIAFRMCFVLAGMGTKWTVVTGSVEALCAVGHEGSSKMM